MKRSAFMGFGLAFLAVSILVMGTCLVLAVWIAEGAGFAGTLLVCAVFAVIGSGLLSGAAILLWRRLIPAGMIDREAARHFVKSLEAAAGGDMGEPLDDLALRINGEERVIPFRSVYDRMVSVMVEADRMGRQLKGLGQELLGQAAQLSESDDGKAEGRVEASPGEDLETLKKERVGQIRHLGHRVVHAGEAEDVLGADSQRLAPSKSPEGVQSGRRVGKGTSRLRRLRAEIVAISNPVKAVSFQQPVEVFRIANQRLGQIGRPAEYPRQDLQSLGNAFQKRQDVERAGRPFEEALQMAQRRVRIHGSGDFPEKGIGQVRQTFRRPRQLGDPLQVLVGSSGILEAKAFKEPDDLLRAELGGDEEVFGLHEPGIVAEIRPTRPTLRTRRTSGTPPGARIAA